MMALSRQSRPCATVRAQRPALRRCMVTRVRAEAAAKPMLAKIADSIGLPTEEGIFGFKPFSEMWVGRWAMFGFVSSIWGEFTTGRGTLGQLGLDTPSVPLLAVLCVVFGGATVAATVSTVSSVMSKKMPRRQLARYKNFLGLNNDKDWVNEAARMKGRPVPPPAAPAVEVLQAEAAAAPAAATELQVDASAAPQAPAPATPQQPATESRPRVDPNSLLMDDLSYARDIELQNGRAAMLGFLAAVLVEAATGQGIIGQLITYAKLSGLLGADSGF